MPAAAPAGYGVKPEAGLAFHITGVGYAGMTAEITDQI